MTPPHGLKTEQRILTNTAVLGLGEAVGQVAGFIFVVACARVYGADVLGWYTMGMAVGGLAAVFVSMGTHGFLLRDLSRHPEDSARKVGGTLPYEALAALGLMTLIAALSLLFIEDRTGRWVVAALGAYQVTLAPAALLLIPFRARQVMWPAAVAGGAERALVVLVALPMMALGVAAVPVFAAFPLSAFVIAGIVLVAANRFLGERVDRRINLVSEQRDLYAAGVPFFASSALEVLYTRIGVVMLTVIAGAESAGIFTAADRLVVAVNIFSVLFVAAFYPAVTHLAAIDRERAAELSNRCMRLVLVLTVPVAGFGGIFHREIIATIFGESFDASALLLLVLSPLLVLKGINGLRTSQAFAIGLQRQVVRVRALMVVLFVASGVVLIHLAGPIGLALSLLLAESVYGLGLRALLVAESFSARALPVIWQPVLAVVAGVGAYALAAELPLPLRAVAVAVVMAAAMFVTGAVRPHDVRFLVSVLRYGQQR